MAGIDLLAKLASHKEKNERDTDKVLSEVHRILNKDLYSEKNILNNLKNYNKLTEVIEEEDVDERFIFKTSEIRDIAIIYRLRFVNSQCYKFDFPYESVLKIENINAILKKNIKGFKVLSTPKFFKDKNCKDSALLFAPTNQGNYYLVHQWGEPLKWHRKYVNWPLRNIENLFITLLVFTGIVTLSLPTYLITLDRKATYWCGYRIGVFFHLLIFFMGFTVYFTFAFSRNLGTSVWDSEQGLG